MSTAPAKFNPPKSCWLPAEKGKGLELFGTFSRKGGQMAMEVTINNKAMQVGNKKKNASFNSASLNFETSAFKYFKVQYEEKTETHFWNLQEVLTQPFLYAS